MTLYMSNVIRGVNITYACRRGCTLGPVRYRIRAEAVFYKPDYK